MKRQLLSLLLTVPLAAGAAAPWTPRDTALELLSEAGLAAEWAQMIDRPSHSSITGVDADMFGRYPSRAALNRYFVGWMIAHPLIAWELPQPWRLGFQGATIGFELAVNRNNASVGCKIHF
jgi:hypothetical protein